MNRRTRKRVTEVLMWLTAILMSYSLAFQVLTAWVLAAPGRWQSAPSSASVVIAGLPLIAIAVWLRLRSTRRAAADVMYRAVKYALDRSQTDADFGYECGFGTETWARLCAAEAAYLNRPVADVEAERKRQRWHNRPRVEELRERLEELSQ